MVSIAAQLNSQRRAPVSMYNPRAMIAPTRRTNAAPARRSTGGRRTTGPVDWSAIKQEFRSTEGAQRKRQEQLQEEAEAQAKASQSGWSKGLGFVVNNPVVRYASIPLTLFDVGRRAVEFGAGEARVALDDAPRPVQNFVGALPGIGNAMRAIDPRRVEADKRSVYEKVVSPSNDFGFGQMIYHPEDPSGWQKFEQMAVGFQGDVAMDPLSFIGGGAGRVATSLTHIDEAADAVRAANTGLKAAEEAGDAARVISATEELSNAQAALAVARETPGQKWHVPLNPTRAGRAELMGELSETAAGRKFLTEMPAEASRAGTRGFQTIDDAAKELLQIDQPGLRLRGFDTRIPGTGRLSNRLNQIGGGAREGISRIPGMQSVNPRRLANIRVPKGLEKAYATLTRGVEGDLLTAATDVATRQQIRRGTGAFTSRGGRAIAQALRAEFKGMDDEAIRAAVHEAETSAEPNWINKVAGDLLDVYENVTGRTLDRKFLRNPDTYFPHVLHPKFRRVLAAASKRGDEAAEEFLRATGTSAEELLEQPNFYLDNMLEGSGFMEKSRKVGTNADGSPNTIKIAGKEITFTEDNLEHINEQLRAAFPTYKGDFYDTNPARVFEAYNSSLARQAGRDLAAQRLINVGNPLATTMTGNLDLTRQALNDALSKQGAAGMLSTAQGKYDPTAPLPEIPEAPLIPGQAEDRARRAAVGQTQAAMVGANAPEEAAALAAELETLPAPTERIGGIAPEDFFVTTKGTAATQARDNQAKVAGTYARAAAAEVAKSDEALRTSLNETRTSIVTPLRTTIAETKQQISAVNTKLRKWAKQVKDMGKLTADNDAELSTVLSNVNTEILNAETKLKRTRASWKGRATRAQRKVEAQLRESVESLRRVRDAALQNAEGAPQAMRDEFLQRQEALDKPVRDATEALLRAEMAVPVPHSQVQVAAAREVLEAAVAEGHRTPEEALAGYRAVVDDIRSGAAAVTGTDMAGTEVADHERRVYGALVEEIREIGSRRKNGKLSKANQLLMDEAVAKRNALALALGVGETATGRAARLSPYDDVMSQLGDLRVAIKNAAPDEVAALRKRRDHLARMFRPGGRFAEEQRARQVLADMDQYADDVATATKDQTKALKAAEYAKQMRQEAIIWADRNRSTRYVAPVGSAPGLLEEQGWGLGQQRIPESIQTPPQRDALATQGGIMVNGLPEFGAIPPPRTEAEALASLESRMEYGSASQQQARAELGRAEKRLGAAEETLPINIATQQAVIGAKMAMSADQELGPLAQRAQTYTNLATDLSDKQNLVAKRDELMSLRDRLNAVNPTYRRADLDRTINEIEAVAKANPLLDDDKLAQVESILQTYRQELQRLTEARIRIGDLDRVVQDAADGKLGPVMIATLNNNWRALHSGPLNTGDIIMDAELHKRFINLFELNRQPQMLGRTFNAFTNLFKTYATMSPGFFVRNTIGGVFMNTSDGVSLAHQLNGAKFWHQWMKGGNEWLERQPRHIRDAFDAAFSSGAGGRFEDFGVMAQGDSAFYNALSSNPFTRRAQKMGSYVEGAMRLGMALDSIDNGMSVSQALGRISRVHFDYNQISGLDDMMKRIVPFWTFMSRNLPLQIQQQWTNPRVYAYYASLTRNFSLPDEEFTPDYWTRQGAWRTPLSIGGNPIYAQPDLGFTRVASDIQMAGDMLSGENPGALLSQTNPLFGAVGDFLMKRDSFYNRNFDDTDYKELSGPVGKPVSMLADVLGQNNEAGQTSENFINLLSSLAPPLNQTMRLVPGAMGDSKAGADTAAKWARYWGLPTQLLTPTQQDNEFWRQYRAMQDEQKRQQAMVRAAG